MDVDFSQTSMEWPDPLALTARYYDPGTPLYATLVQHGMQVRARALEIAHRLSHLQPDLTFIAEAAMLHDIGIFMTHSPKLGCHGAYPYVCHGTLGKTLLEHAGLAKHAAVCERHVGVGFTAAEIAHHKLPLPHRDMLPVTLEEKIICIADKFFSKSNPQTEKSPHEVLESLTPFGPDKMVRFIDWMDQLGLDAHGKWRKLFMRIKR